MCPCAVYRRLCADWQIDNIPNSQQTAEGRSVVIKIKMMMNSPKKIKSFLFPLILICSLSLIYLRTMAPGLSWANDGADGGDLITASVTNGIAHPTGYPFYLILAKIFQTLPFDSLAYRTNLMSGFFAVLTSFLVYIFVVRVCVSEHKYLAGMLAGFSMGLAPLFWSQAVITEVYTLHIFMMAVILNISVLGHTNNSVENRVWLDRMIGIVYGLGAGNHITTVLIIPGALAISCIQFDDALQKYVVKWASLARQVLWMTAGLSVYILLPIRAIADPVINWANPINLENFWWLISGKIYREYYLQKISLDRVAEVLPLAIKQFDYIGVIAGSIGIGVFFKSSKAHLLTLYNALIFLCFSILYQPQDSLIYFLPVLLSFSIWIGIGIEYIFKNLFLKNRTFYWAFLVIMFLNYIVGAFTSKELVDASQDQRAENFGKILMLELPNNALVFVEGDKAVFTVWYFHFALKERQDLFVIAADLLHYEWYQETLRTAYPSLKIPRPFPFASMIVDANPSYINCYVNYEAQERYFCKDDP